MSRDAEKEYVSKLPPEGRQYLRTRPFGLTPKEDALVLRQFSDLLHLLDLPKDSLVLDAGTGPGWTAVYLWQAGYRVTGVDISRDMVAIAQDRAKAQQATGVKLAVCDVETLPFDDCSFDGVMMYGALHHVESEAACIQECYRVLTPGGTIVISEPNWLHRMSRTARKERVCYGVIDKGYTPRHLKRMLKRAGFIKSRRHFATSAPYGTSVRDILRHVLLPGLQRTILGHFATHVLLVAVKPTD